MRILIADDERLVRLSIRSMIEELQEKGLCERAVIEEAQNGIELESALRAFHPHLAFVDIKMPGKSGLEVIEQAGKEVDRLFWVLLTGYAEFSFAKRAIDAGVLDYLVKPASSRDVLKVIQAAERKALILINAETLLHAGKLSSLLRRTTDQEFDSWFAHRLFLGGLLLWNRDEHEKNEHNGDFPSSDVLLMREFKKHLDSSLERFTLQYYPFGICSAAVYSENGNLIVSVSHQSRIPDGLRAIGEHLDTFITGILDSSFPEGRPLTWRPLPVSSDAQRFVDRVAHWEQSEHERTQPVPGLRAVKGQSVKRTEQIEKAIDLVNRTYTRDIGLAQIADELGLTPNYLSSEFKACTGVNFTDYITHLRMESACDLLKSPGMSVKMTAAELGYTSWRYFSKLFCQTYGIRPSQYIEENR